MSTLDALLHPERYASRLAGTTDEEYAARLDSVRGDAACSLIVGAYVGRTVTGRQSVGYTRCSDRNGSQRAEAIMVNGRVRIIVDMHDPEEGISPKVSPEFTNMFGDPCAQHTLPESKNDVGAGRIIAPRPELHILVPPREVQAV